MAPREISPEISTGCPELDLVWKTYAVKILNRPGVMIEDTEDALNWHAFLGHSIDMQGFRAAEFAGVDTISKPAPGFVSLKDRGIGVSELGALWDAPAIQGHLRKKDRGPLSTTLDLLKTEGGNNGRSLAEAFEKFPYRKGHWTVRALLQNSYALKNFGYSFRKWLEMECSELSEMTFPPPDFRKSARNGLSLEMALRKRLEMTFYYVGQAMASYMLCDWQLWLWYEGKTEVFANFKLDSFHEQFVKRYGRGTIPADEIGFSNWWLTLYPLLPPRLANECIWLGMEHGIV